MKSLRHLFTLSILFILASCAQVGVGVSGGSNSGVSVGAGVNIHLYTEKNK